ncbi:MAG: redoxin domain-containing protein [Muribaculaceae bacterium]
MLRKFFSMGALAVAMAASAFSYQVNVELSVDDEGAMAYLTNYDNGAKLDSALVENAQLCFEGQIAEAVAARLVIDGNRRILFFLEEGTININDEGAASGTPLNDRWNEFETNSLNTLEAEYLAATTQEQQEDVYNRYNATISAFMDENIHNLIGFYLFCGNMTDMDMDEINRYLALEPSLAQSKRVQNAIASIERRAATGEGCHYADFEVNGEKLSDYVGRDGHYLIVDFWASWCGPCKRQLVVLKDIYAQYHDRGVDVLGVAVWDEPDATRQAIVDHELPWHCIIDAQTIPTDIYGIQGIPCILIIAPDGTIISRDKQGDELKADVAKIFGE